MSRSIQVGELSRAKIDVLGLSIGVMPLLTLLLAVVLFLVLQWVLKRTRFGRIVRATADRRDIVRLFGVRPDRVYNYVMAISLALGAIGGVLLAVRSSFTPFSGAERLLIAFEVVVLGGIGSFWGALVGGVALGMAQLVGLEARFQRRAALRPSLVLHHAAGPARRPRLQPGLMHVEGTYPCCIDLPSVARGGALHPAGGRDCGSPPNVS